MHTCDDYETLRRFAVEGCEAHSGDVRELPVFLTHGVVAWMRKRRGGRITAGTKRYKHNRRFNAADLTVLLANMIES
jgi:hypothetical protein